MPFGLDLISYGYTALQDAIGKLYVNPSLPKNTFCDESWNEYSLISTNVNFPMKNVSYGCVTMHPDSSFRC